MLRLKMLFTICVLSFTLLSMTKSEYITWLNGRSYLKEVGTPVLNTGQSNATLEWSVYDIDLLELNLTDSTGEIRSHRFAVYDEGGGSEAVFNQYVPYYKENLSGYNALIAEIESITNLRGYIIRKIDTEQQFALVKAAIFNSPNIDIVWYLVYNDSGLTYAAVNNPEDW